VILNSINLSTGPVNITAAVQKALQELPVSHRSEEFRKIFHHTRELLNQHFNVNQTYLLTTSGTLANEAMMQEIKMIQGQGLVLSNGEFGNRLIAQAERNRLEYQVYCKTWGERISIKELEAIFIKDQPAWILFCHCETSTGLMNDMAEIATLAKKLGAMVFVDCMSTVGTKPMDLSSVTMASASSGKGLASVPGIAIVFSNIEPLPKPGVPVCLDLHHYHEKDGLPFTISSNLVKALNISIKEKLSAAQYELAESFRYSAREILNNYGLVPFIDPGSAVFTVVEKDYRLMKYLQKRGVVLSYESDYLKNREWWQMASLGCYKQTELNGVIQMMRKAFEKRKQVT
jgi:aspartate aminotransferase-like enzyme